MYGIPDLDWTPIDHFETFAGEKAAGRSAISFELNDDPHSQDILSCEGFANCIYQTLRTRGQPQSARRQCDGCEVHDFVPTGKCQGLLVDSGTTWIQYHAPPPDVPEGFEAFERFGRSVSKIRSQNAKRLKKQARRFLREAFQTQNDLDTSERSHNHWMKQANLLPVLQFLSAVQ
ncbi:unnamed protein product [Durusdinium trenchii]|uniref:Uncharacterized protein n=1 Tax=Durusdinium trenchii TaxID=1381693 RepID=A0ABP0H845_9DINO